MPLLDDLIYRALYRPFAKMLRRFVRESGDFVTDSIVSKYDPTIEYLYWEISELRSQVRYLVAEHVGSLPSVPATKSAFNYQWDALPEGEAMLNDPVFRAGLKERICRFAGKPEGWFAGKKILDAGCGQGRFTLGLAALGAEVVATDQSEAGLARAEQTLREEGVAEKVTFLQADLLQPLPLQAEYDMVWSFGVLHHTGDTFSAFRNIAPLVKPGGLLFLMLYGEPRWWNPDEFEYRATYARLRQQARNLDAAAIVDLIKVQRPGDDVHGWFDAVAPQINDCYQFAEIQRWLIDAGFIRIGRTVDDVHHHVIAERPIS